MNLANKITITRILLVPFFIASIVYYKPSADSIPYLPLTIFLIAVMTDALDGFIARKFKQKTELGTILDPIADKLLIVTGFICLSMSKSIALQTTIMPPWLPIVVISRDIIIVLGAVIIYIIKTQIQITPSILGKITTFFQMSSIVAILIKYPYSSIVLNLAGILTVLSGIDYIIKGSRVLGESNEPS